MATTTLRPRRHVARSGIRAAVLLVLVLSVPGLPGCARPSYLLSNPVPGPELRRADGLSRHVVLISIDGLRPDAIAASGAATLDRLMRGGSYTLSAKTIVPSKTLPSHVSMLTGQPPELHGIRWNRNRTDARGTITLPTIFSLARSHGYLTAAFFGKSKLQHLQRPDSIDYSQAPGGWFGRWSDARTVRDVNSHLAARQPNLLFVHLSGPDDAGHRTGWMSADYRAAVRAADSAVAAILAAAEEAFGSDNYTVLVTSDHGGQGRDHGSDDLLDVTIPWIAWGAAVTPGMVTSPVNTMDTAATVLYVLGIEPPSDWEGRPVVASFARGGASTR
jgi:predicted AlkP superfamily pyrophosphatase or phosphodiesterase